MITQSNSFIIYFFSRLVIDIDQTALVLLKVDPFANVSDHFEFLNLSCWEANNVCLPRKKTTTKSAAGRKAIVYITIFIYN